MLPAVDSRDSCIIDFHLEVSEHSFASTIDLPTSVVHSRACTDEYTIPDAGLCPGTRPMPSGEPLAEEKNGDDIRLT
jgi:hypothetical protein